MNGMNVRKKNIIAMGLSIILMLVLCACGEENKWLFSLNGEKLYSKDVAAFVYIYVTEYNIRNDEQLEELYESGVTYGEYHKQQLEEDLIETVLLYKEATANDIKLSDDAKERIAANVSTVMNRFGKETLEKADVSEADIEHIYEMRYLGEIYMEAFSGDKETNAELDSTRYVQVYQVTFPVVKLDNNGMVQSDENGKLEKISLSEISEMEQMALTFAEQAQAGEDMTILLEECDESVTAIEKILKYNDLDVEYRKAIDDLSVGDVSDVIESDYGYYVIRLLDADAIEYRETIMAHETDTEMMSQQEQEWERLYSAYVGTNTEYKNVELWKAIDLEDYLQ